MTALNIFDLWGKTVKGDRVRYHPAIYHMVDVAHVAQVLISKAGAQRLRDALHRAWDGADLEALDAWLPFIMALHDIGKLSTPFQGQQTTPESHDHRMRLIHLGFPMGTDGDAPPSHSGVSAWWLNECLPTIEPDMHRNTVCAIRDAAGGHHGQFATGLKSEVAAYLARYEPLVWNDLRQRGYTQLRAALGPATGALALIGAPRRLRPATAALTGLTVIADWVASNTYYFPVTPTLPFTNYVLTSAHRAQWAVNEVGLAMARSSRPYPGYQATFHQKPRHVQVQVDALTAADLHSPGIFIIEAPTGEGKTEAALALARRLAAHGASDEIYIGLPTMATSNQMFKRVERFFVHLYDDPGAVRLAHGQSFLVQDELRRAVRLAMAHGDADPAARPGSGAASDEQVLAWFSGSKRALLAPFGVGTVDQIELAGLNVRHAILRLFGLAGKIVIIDEVHAYDTYMSAILEHTLMWLASMGTSVILLSATLPQARQQALVRHYLAGLRHVQPAHISVAATSSYPVITVANAAHERQLPVTTARQMQLTIRCIYDETPAQQAQRLLDLTADGGAVARICNRVDTAQQIYQALKQLDSPNLTLIHAQYPLSERLRRETQVATLVGNTTTRSPHERFLIIGTQVLEQSLDYDVDVMVTDLCPLDLLLQRAGRLHRHVRERPVAHQQPVLYLQQTLRPDGLPDLTHWAHIYAPLVVWRSWLALRDRAADTTLTLELPNDYRPLIEAVYGTDEGASTGNPTWDTVLANAAAAHQQDQISQRNAARERLTPIPQSPDPLAVEGTQFIEDAEGQLAGWQIAKTRLGERITVIPLYQVAGGLARTANGPPIGPIAPEDVSTQRTLLNQSLPISNRRVLTYLRDHGSWRQQTPPPLLKYTPPLVLDAAGRATIHGVALRLDVELGLVIEGKRSPYDQ